MSDSALLYSFQQRKKAVLQDLSRPLIGSSFDFQGLLLAATPLDCCKSLPLYNAFCNLVGMLKHSFKRLWHASAAFQPEQAVWMLHKDLRA